MEGEVLIRKMPSLDAFVGHCAGLCGLPISIKFAWALDLIVFFVQFGGLEVEQAVGVLFPGLYSEVKSE